MALGATVPAGYLLPVVDPPSKAEEDPQDGASGQAPSLPEQPPAGAFPTAVGSTGISRESEHTPSGVDASVDEAAPPQSTVAVVREQSGMGGASRSRLIALAATVLSLGAAAMALLVLRSNDDGVTDNAAGSAQALESGKQEPPLASNEPPSSRAPTPDPIEKTEVGQAAQDDEPAAKKDPATRPDESTAPDPSGAPLPKGIPTYVSEPAVVHLSGVAMRRAQRCHPGGHAVGTAEVHITFQPNGHVSDAHVEGEPIASAPVANCILLHAKSIILPRFEGPPFTLRHPITLE